MPIGSITNIGRPRGCGVWLVDPGDHTRLAPIGAVGELLLEGPSVGRGYFWKSGRFCCRVHSSACVSVTIVISKPRPRAAMLSYRRPRPLQSSERDSRFHPAQRRARKGGWATPGTWPSRATHSSERTHHQASDGSHPALRSMRKSPGRFNQLLGWRSGRLGELTR